MSLTFIVLEIHASKNSARTIPEKPKTENHERQPKFEKDEKLR